MFNVVYTTWNFSLSVCFFIFAVDQCSLISPLSVLTYLALKKGKKKKPVVSDCNLHIKNYT